jgi:phage terminase small subunit
LVHQLLLIRVLSHAYFARMLTQKAERFVEFYAVTLNATEAAIRAGYSPKTATVQGSRLLTNAKVQQALQRAKSVLAEQTQITKEALVADLHAEFKASRGVNAQAVARLGELLARMHGYIDDKPQAPQQLVNLIIQR